MSNPDKLCKTIAYQFSDSSLLDKALTHRSASAKNNERLEFLGDAVLSLVITGELIERFPTSPEGILSRMRAKLVRGTTLAEIAKELELGSYIKLGSGELKSGGHRRASILADTFEALIGAVYLDGGIVAATDFIKQLFKQRISELNPDESSKDAKTLLQEYLQARGLPLPEYNVTATEGRSHEQTFQVECAIETADEIVTGTGSSRRKAEQDAAQKTLKLLEQ